jgi:glucose-6-phosphate isomerase
MHFTENDLLQMEPRIQTAYRKILELEDGALSNPDENQMVGHYWLRAPELAPVRELQEEIRNTQNRVMDFACRIHQGAILGQTGQTFKHILILGIGGSHLGPYFLSEALRGKEDPCTLHFINNTDPDGIDRLMDLLEHELAATLTVVISKSGATVETRNSMEEVRIFYGRQGLDFARQAVCITRKGSLLDELSQAEGWLASFPIWDWVGGRTSLFSPVGLLPLALQGINVRELLEGACQCDALTRCGETRKNPAALMALMWYIRTKGRGGQNMVMLPYKDRLELLGKYLQQLVMESLGKEKDLDGRTVCQGITVYGNKGTADQHAFMQQLLEGPNDFFVEFIEVLKDRKDTSPKIAEDSSSGDYLQAFLIGTRNALSQRGRESMTLTIPDVSPKSLGALIALFERTVSLYAQLIHINAYHQPAVEIGKKGAQDVIRLKNQALSALSILKEPSCTLEELAQMIENSAGNGNKAVERDNLFQILQHLAANPYPDEKIFLENREGPLEDLRIRYVKNEKAEALFQK